jgi:hypothetical protein
MSNEAQIQASLTITKTVGGNLQYRSYPTLFNADVTGAMGPTPGAIEVLTAGTDVDLSQIQTYPGFCRITNQDSTNWVSYGIWDPTISRYFPLGEVLPGEFFILRLSRELGEIFAPGTGTGTAGPSNNRLRFKAHTSNCIVLIEAFEA